MFSASNIIEEPMLIEPKLIGAPPPPKKQKLSQEEDQREQALKSEHSYLISVRDEHLQHLTSITVFFTIIQNERFVSFDLQKISECAKIFVTVISEKLSHFMARQNGIFV